MRAYNKKRKPKHHTATKYRVRRYKFNKKRPVARSARSESLVIKRLLGFRDNLQVKIYAYEFRLRLWRVK